MFNTADKIVHGKTVFSLFKSKPELGMDLLLLLGACAESHNPA